MKNRRNYYRILQVQPDAPAEVIRSSYRTLMRELKQHPDLGGSTLGASVLNQAYEVLSNPERRAQYDKALFAEYTKRPALQDKRPLTTVFCPFCKKPLAREPQAGDRCRACESVLQSKKPAEVRNEYQRSIPRMKRDDRILYFSSWPGKGQKARMADFSPKGMRYLCSERLAPRTTLKISSPFFDASAAVTNVQEKVFDGQRLYAVGVVFVAISFQQPRGTFLSTSA